MGEVVLAMFFICECDFDSTGVDLSGRNLAKSIADVSGVHALLLIPVSIWWKRLYFRMQLRFPRTILGEKRSNERH